jgi:hypothetical protein
MTSLLVNQLRGSPLVNTDGSNYPGGMGSLSKANFAYGLPNFTRGGADAASASALNQEGGGPVVSKKKIKNIVNLYRMPRGKKVRTLKKRRLMSLYKKKSVTGRKRSTRTNKRRSRRMRGGNSTYHQFSSQIPNTPTYSLANTVLNPTELALANPPPFQKLPGTTNGLDNFNMNTKHGFQYW